MAGAEVRALDAPEPKSSYEKQDGNEHDINPTGDKPTDGEPGRDA